MTQKAVSAEDIGSSPAHLVVRRILKGASLLAALPVRLPLWALTLPPAPKPDTQPCLHGPASKALPPLLFKALGCRHVPEMLTDFRLVSRPTAP